MPAIIELRLSPDRPVEPTTRQLHGLACALFDGAHPGGHDGHVKPFTVWPLRKCEDGSLLLRSAWLRHGFPQTVLAGWGRVQYGPASCAVTDVAFRPVSHADLACVPLIDGIRLTLLSPAYFSTGGRHAADPDPRLIAGSWRRQWNASLPEDSPLAVTAALWRDIHLALHLTGAGLRTETRDTGYRTGRGANGPWRVQAGLVGSATLRLESAASEAARRGFARLARFAEYCGTGAQVTHGFGATRVTLLHSAWPQPDTMAASATV